MRRNIVDMVTRPLEFVLTEEAFADMQDSITDAIVAAISPGDDHDRLYKVIDIIAEMRNNLFANIEMRRAIDE